MLIYKQKTGQFYRGDSLLAVGYSGYGAGKNQPESQHVQNLGPIPQGAYLVGEPSTSLDHGPVALHVLPLTGTQTFGRSGFLVHGDSIAEPGSASHGCIILPRQVREAIRDNPDRLLVVLSGNV